MKKQKIYVSVIMAAHQLEAYLAEAIESVLHQTYPYFELVIVEDGSTDQTLHIAQTYASQDTRIRLIQHSKNMGITQTYNDLLNSARYDWVFTLDGDDRMLPNRIERQLSFLQEHPQLVLAGALSYYINVSGKRIGQYSNPLTTAEKVKQAIEGDHPIWFTSTAVVFRRQTALKVGGYRQVYSNGDTDLYSRLAYAGSVLCQEELLGEYRKLPNSMSVMNIILSLKIDRWISACMRTRRLGLTEPDLETYLANEDKLPFLIRLTIKRRDVSAILFKLAIAAYSNRKFGQALLYGVLCGLVQPSILWRRIRSRKLLLHS